MPNQITDLRELLFETIRALKDPDKPMDLDRAKAIADVAQTVINSAKVEVDYLRLTGQRTGTDFLPPAPEVPKVTGPAMRAVQGTGQKP